jgi:phenylalanyl-tRNA synthetase alpha chain
LKDRIAKIVREAAVAINAAADAEALEQLRVKYIGRKSGEFRDIMSALAALPPEERKEVGALANKAKDEITSLLDAKKSALAAAGETKKSALDVTLPGRKMPVGSLHPISLVVRDLRRIFQQLGFTWIEGPEIEDQWHNFDALNIPKGHVARDESDNFYLSENQILRSQTSSLQIRYMEEHKPPIRIIAPGRVYRPDTVDATHHYFFHQVELLMVDRGLTFVDLRNIIALFVHGLYGPEINVRFRPSYFPFTEPSAETDFNCTFCKGAGCRVCKQTGWLEMGGCGMVDPNVLEAVNIDPEIYTGFAFGFGIDRMAMSKYGIDDIRLFTENDVRFLKQF